MCVADVDESPGTTEELEMAALVCKWPLERKRGRKTESHNWLLVI